MSRRRRDRNKPLVGSAVLRDDGVWIASFQIDSRGRIDAHWQESEMSRDRGDFEKVAAELAKLSGLPHEDCYRQLFDDSSQSALGYRR